MQNKLPAIIAIIIILLLVVGGVFYFLSNKEKKPQTTTQTTTTETTTSQPKNEAELQNQVADILKTNDFSKCDAVKDEIYKTACINNIALNLAEANNDPSYCKKIDGRLMSQESCERQVGFKAAVEKSNITICEGLSGTLPQECKDNFYTQTVLKSGDPTLCGKITDKTKSDNCYNNYYINSEFKNNISGFDCSLFKGADAVSDCKTIKNININGSFSDPAACYNLKTTLFLSYCL